jgi:hypothetical protein
MVVWKSFEGSSSLLALVDVRVRALLLFSLEVNADLVRLSGTERSPRPLRSAVAASARLDDSLQKFN